MARPVLQFNPYRAELYVEQELLGSFDLTDPQSYCATLDFRVYRDYVMSGRYRAKDYFVSMMQALHDHSITEAMRHFLADKSKVTAVMGGHKLPRGSVPYRAVVEMSRALTKAEIFMVSGGGPGAMEAVHLGARLSEAPDVELESALKKLESQTVMPESGKIVAPDGTINETIVEKVHAWYRPAIEIARESRSVSKSLAIPTWHYGHEPPTPLASHIAKYFQNSIREDGLLAIAREGIIFVEGKAGTVQEIFQDAAQNYYESFDWLSPMVFVGNKYWKELFPVEPLLESVYRAGNKEEEYKRSVFFTDSTEEAVDFLRAWTPRKN